MKKERKIPSNSSKKTSLKNLQTHTKICTIRAKVQYTTCKILDLKYQKNSRYLQSYALSHRYNDLLADSNGFVETPIIQEISDINFEAKKMNIEIDKTPSNKNFAKKNYH